MPKKTAKKLPAKNKSQVTGKYSSRSNLFFTMVVLSSAIVIGISVWIMGTYASNIKEGAKWCGKTQPTTSQSPAKLKTSVDHFEKGNYLYDTGDCTGAIASYTQAIKMNSKYAEAFNNRAYTYMMMNDYINALPDLDNAIKLRPAYVNALMNRGDIYNYYYMQDKEKAIADYDKVIAQGPEALKGQPTCGHRLMAVYNHNLILTFWHFITKTNAPGCF